MLGHFPLGSVSTALRIGPRQDNHVAMAPSLIRWEMRTSALWPDLSGHLVAPVLPPHVRHGRGDEGHMVGLWSLGGGPVGEESGVAYFPFRASLCWRGVSRTLCCPSWASPRQSWGRRECVCVYVVAEPDPLPPCCGGKLME